MFISTRLLRPHKSGLPFLCAFALLLLFVSSGSFILAQPPSKVWDKTIGGDSYEDGVKAIPTSDGGFIIGGYSFSNVSGEKSENDKGLGDYWVVKLDASGNKQWDKTIGGNSADYLADIRQTSDGGYILAGSSQSNASGDKKENNVGQDAWIVKLSSSGSIEWESTIGGDSGDDAQSIVQTADGGYIFVGYSYSGISGDKSEASKGDSDYWVVKLNSDGTKAWDKTYGGSSYETPFSISVTADGGYIIGGTSGSGISGDKSQANFGQTDLWVLKLSSTGQKEWDKSFGGDNQENVGIVTQTPNGDYLLASYTSSGISGNKSADNQAPSSTDFWVVKMDGEGNKIWDKTYGGGRYSRLTSMALTYDGGFALGGWSLPNVPTGPFDFDYRLIRLSSDGIYQWETSFAGPEEDRLYSVQQTPDRGYILAGYSYSGIGPDKSETNTGDRDFWIIRLATDPLPVTLAAFSASKESSTALLQWKTTSESASSEFEIQHSLDGRQWQRIGSVAAAGESNNDKTYRFVHTEPVNGQNNLYRLKMIDTDGTFAFSKINALLFNQKNLGRIYPNPAASGQLTVDVKNWASVKNVQISTLNALTVYDSGQNPQQSIDINNLSTGIYMLKVFKKDGTSEQFRLVR
ncbi:hypothetical protein J2Y45_000217 [Dyadobacter sp. BE34]|uniref:Secretion system C-terminal sorting domain-containing protein n=1 Tax=Dyadobacter fermentans TaxID=94254 RepID=A0ABU1R7S6_9BACT|nr:MULTISPECIES: T9SS type A sorting domain-containing protein [Dyadobacter]MDR6809464.1 hypothetical protein [Dyadobacter fermentans]MDR7047414.1 hypothetical protein [Dyadobacter sp. BE242]MDR7195091.1 hypothetical protein [Dyadobacter sp. BE34]MDR7214364.1 hypothetical protein [Dyadobacter sp. BE31]MDR7267013.1 hypothetical protein [Dyadobacter sp. BE32]